jgi:hypothetical protein
MQKEELAPNPQRPGRAAIAWLSVGFIIVVALFAGHAWGLRSGRRSIRLHVEYNPDSGTVETYTYIKARTSTEIRSGDYYLLDGDGRVLIHKIYNNGRGDYVEAKMPLLQEPGVREKLNGPD